MTKIELQIEQRRAASPILDAIVGSFKGEAAPFTIHTFDQTGRENRILVSPNATGETAIVAWDVDSRFGGRGIVNLLAMRWKHVEVANEFYELNLPRWLSSLRYQ